MNTKKEAKFDVYEFINQQVINQLEKGVLPWRKPWKVAIVEGQEYTIPHNYATKRPYTGVNAFLLALTLHQAPMFLTARAAPIQTGTRNGWHGEERSSKHSNCVLEAHQGEDQRRGKQ